MQWQADNKLCFFLAIIQHGGVDSHITRLHHLLTTRRFTEHQTFSTKIQLAIPKHPRSFIDEMFAYYILPFHHRFNDSSSSCHTPTSSTPSLADKSNAAKDLNELQEGDRVLAHNDFKKNVGKRDGVCLFSWEKDVVNLQAAHIIAQKNIPMANVESSLLLRAGLTQKHQVQNGLLLCSGCHLKFDSLKRYVHVMDDQLVVKVVNESDDPTSEEHMNWGIALGLLKNNRSFLQSYMTDGRTAVESNGEMALYFVLVDPARLPNSKALEFHKAACLIWRMAGGAESDEEYCPDDDDDGVVPVGYESKCKSIEEWMDSSVHLLPGYGQ